MLQLMIVYNSYNIPLFLLLPFSLSSNRSIHVIVLPGNLSTYCFSLSSRYDVMRCQCVSLSLSLSLYLQTLYGLSEERVSQGLDLVGGRERGGSTGGGGSKSVQQEIEVTIITSLGLRLPYQATFCLSLPPFQHQYQYWQQQWGEREKSGRKRSRRQRETAIARRRRRSS